MDSFERGGFVFDVRDGGPTEGEVVVLLHGFPQDAASWTEVEKILHEGGYRTLAPDLRGVSVGARPTEVSQYRTIESVHDVVAMLDAAGVERAHIVGHDWGGFVAWAMPLEAPDRVRTLTVVSTPHPAALKKSLTRSKQGLQSWYMGLFQVPWAAEKLLTPGKPVWNAMVRGLPSEHKERHAQRLADETARTAALNWYRVLRMELPSPSVAWHRIDVPTLYVWGERDPALGRAAAELTADYVTGPYQFEVLRAGHWIPETRPVLLGQLLVTHLGRHE